MSFMDGLRKYLISNKNAPQFPTELEGGAPATGMPGMPEVGLETPVQDGNQSFSGSLLQSMQNNIVEDPTMQPTTTLEPGAPESAPTGFSEHMQRLRQDLSRAKKPMGGL